VSEVALMSPPSLTSDENLDSDAQKLMLTCETFDTAAALIGEHSALADGEEAVAVPQSPALDSAMPRRADARTARARRGKKFKFGTAGHHTTNGSALWTIQEDSRVSPNAGAPRRRLRHATKDEVKASRTNRPALSLPPSKATARPARPTRLVPRVNDTLANGTLVTERQLDAEAKRRRKQDVLRAVHPVDASQ
jgi:hypothetical protein